MAVKGVRGETRELLPRILGIPGRSGPERGGFREQRILDGEDHEPPAGVFGEDPGVAKRDAARVRKVDRAQDGSDVDSCRRFLQMTLPFMIRTYGLATLGSKDNR